MNHVHHFDEERTGAGSGIEYLNERLVRWHSLGDRKVFMASDHLRPGGDVREPIFEAELAPQQFVD